MLRGVRVTLVEDEADTRNVIRWILEQAGAEVQAVDSAAKALQLLKKSEGTESEVLVSDIGMSGEDGNDLIRKIRALDARENSAARIPAIAITAYAGDIDRRRALRAGYTAFLPKPIEADELILLIASLAARCKSSITRPES
jgi:CheY-like chemotaxis protein